MEEAGTEPLLLLKNISKSFSGISALQHVDLQVFSGEVHALMGENGAGKSTLMKIVTGIHKMDSGHIFLKGEERVFKNPSEAITAGISMIQQELNYFPNMTVAENIFINREPLRFSGLFVDQAAMQKMTGKLLKENGIDIDPRSMMRERTIAEKQMIEIIKAVSRDAQLIIMDEPTSSLSAKEIKKLFSIIGNLKSKGVSVIYISHRMDEIFSIADTITVLRDGRVIDSGHAKMFSSQTLITAMIGRELNEIFPQRKHSTGKVVLEVKNLSRKKAFNQISFRAHQGEILGITGLMGAGRTELIETVFGIEKAEAGEVHIHGKRVQRLSPAFSVKNKMALVTEDRKHKGIYPDGSVVHNMTLCNLEQYCRLKQLIDLKREKQSAVAMVSKLNIKTAGIHQSIRNLSGGNQQKVILAKWLLTDPQILLLDEPTAGIDIGAKAEIYKLISGLAEEGKTIIMVSSENSEILGLCDRVLVMCEGNLTADLKRTDCTQENIMKAAVAFKN